MSLDIDTIPPRAPKHPAEVLDLGFDFSGLVPAGLSITQAIAKVSDPTGAAPTDSMGVRLLGIDTAENTIDVRISGGTADKSYAVAVMAILTSGERKVLRTYIDVGQGIFGPDLIAVTVIQQTLGQFIQAIEATV